MTAADPRDGLHGLVAKWSTEAAICGIGGTRAAYKACADELEAALAHARPEAVDSRLLDAIEQYAAAVEQDVRSSLRFTSYASRRAAKQKRKDKQKAMRAALTAALTPERAP